MKFIYINYLFLIIPIFFLILYIYYFNIHRKKILFSWILDLKSIFKKNTYFYKLYYILIFLIFLFFLLIFSKPVVQKSNEFWLKNWIDIQILLDVSFSMLAEDMSPNRLEVAKSVILDFVDKIYTDRVWLIIYAWKTFTSLPLSFDYNIIKKTINKINVYTINQNFTFLQGTAIWDAMILASKYFSNYDREKVIILLTDWEANRWINPIEALNYIKTKNDKKIKIYTIWIWWKDKTTVKIKNPQWIEEVIGIWWVDEKILKLISQNTWWEYFRATDKDSLEKIFDKISKLEKKDIILETIYIDKEEYRVFLYILILLFLFLIILKQKKKI